MVRPRFRASTIQIRLRSDSNPARIGGADELGLPVGPLEVEQRPLAVQTAAVPGQGAGRADHPMAGDDDRHGVATVRETDGPGCRRLADPGGQLAVGDGLAVRDLEQTGPDPPLEVRALEPEGEVELGELASSRPAGVCAWSSIRTSVMVSSSSPAMVTKPTGLSMMRYRVLFMGSGCHDRRARSGGNQTSRRAS
jgi:hypothetical protein